MPYLIVQDRNRYCIHKELPDGSRGERVACHDTEKEAEEQRRALYAAETKELDMSEETHEKMSDYHFTAALDFEELEAEKEARDMAHEITETAEYIPTLTQNIIMSDEPDKPGRFAKMLEQAKTRFSEFFGGSTDDQKGKEIEDHTSLMIQKNAAGRYVWIAQYSNNVRDIDSPPEIIAAKSHARFVEMVDKGEYPMPELWIWHKELWKIGQATVVDFDRDTGFAIAAGYIDKDKHDIARTIAAIDPTKLRLSHGMPIGTIVRSKEDPTVIIEHQTKEISVLPAWAAANPLTGFVMTAQKETTMIDPKKSQEIQNDLGIPVDQLEAVEAANAAAKAAVDESGAETKEKAEEEQTPEVQETAAQTEPTTPDEQPDPEPQAVEPEPVEEPETPPELKAQDVADVLKEVAENFTKTNEAIMERIGELEKAVLALSKTDQEKIKKEIQLTPKESLRAQMGSVIGKDATRIDGRTTEGKEGPKETPVDKAMNSAGIPILAKLPNWREELQKLNQ